MFDSHGVLRKYNSVKEIMQEFFNVRLEFYQKRKDYLVGFMAAEMLKMDNVLRFIQEKIDGIIVVGELLSEPKDRGHQPERSVANLHFWFVFACGDLIFCVLLNREQDQEVHLPGAQRARIRLRSSERVESVTEETLCKDANLASWCCR